MKIIRRFICWLTLTATISGCGYSLAAKNAVIKPGQVLAVRMFDNRTYQPDIDAELRKAFVDELASRGEKVSAADSDLVISGEIVSLTNEASAFSGDDTAMFYRITLRVHAQLSDRKSGKVIWKGEESIGQGYPANSDLALQRNAYSAAVTAACTRVAELLVIKMNQSF